MTQNPYFVKILQLSQKKKQAVYLVGGFLRDQYLNRSGCLPVRQAGDFDFAVSKDAIVLAKSFARSIKGAFVLLDEDHPCARVVKKHNGQVWTFDFSDFRAPTLEKDLALRDFTINTLALNLKTIGDPSSLIDRQGALKDLKSKTVRMVAARAFSDDPLRLMRAFSLFAQLGFKIEAKTLKQIQKDAHLISKVSIERVREEWFKVIASNRVVDTIIAMNKVGLLHKVIPQLSVMEGVHQGGYHHLDVWKHSLEVVNQFEELTELFLKDSVIPAKVGPHTGHSQKFGIQKRINSDMDPRFHGDDKSSKFIQEYLQEEIGGGHKRLALLKFACLLHDIGKPQTRKKEKDRMTFHGHEHVGAGITRLVAKQLKLSSNERYYLEDMVTWHLRPGYLSNFKKPSERVIFRFLRDTKGEALSVLLLALADQRATRGPLSTKLKEAHHRKICWSVIDRIINTKDEKPVVRLLTGHDLIKKLKLKPSPLFTKILNEITEAQALGKVTTKSEALALAANIKKW